METCHSKTFNRGLCPQKGNLKMTNSNVTSKGFSFAGVRDAKKERTAKIESARRDQEWENHKAKELAEAKIRNSQIRKDGYGNELNFSACIKELSTDIRHTKNIMRETAKDYQKDDNETIYNVKRDYDIAIIWFDENGRNGEGSYFTSASQITRQDIINEKNDIVDEALRNPTQFKGAFGISFDGRIDISTRDKKDGYVDYEIGEYFGSNIWDSEKGWLNQ